MFLTELYRSDGGRIAEIARIALSPPGSMDAESVLQLALGHLGAPYNTLALGPGVELLPGVAVGATRSSHRRFTAAGCNVFCVSPTHCKRALALAGRADVRSPLPLLLAGSPLGF